MALATLWIGEIAVISGDGAASETQDMINALTVVWQFRLGV